LFHLRVLNTEQLNKGCSRNKGEIAKRQSGIRFKLNLEFQTNYGTVELWNYSATTQIDTVSA